MPRMFLLIALLAIGGLLVCNDALFATTYVFGEDGLITDLTFYGSSWSSTNTYIIAGDCIINGGDTLTINSGVSVYFDYDYDGDYTEYPTITLEGTLICSGSSVSHVTFTNYSGTNKGEFEGLKVDGSGSSKEGVLECDYTDFFYGGKSYGLIQVVDETKIELENCIIRHSNEDGLFFSGEGGYAHFSYCDIDSCDDDGIGWSEEEGVSTDSLSLNCCSFTDNFDAERIFLLQLFVLQ